MIILKRDLLGSFWVTKNVEKVVYLLRKMWKVKLTVVFIIVILYRTNSKISGEWEDNARPINK